VRLLRLAPPAARDWRAFLALTRVEALLAGRRLENLLVTLGLPVLLLVVLATVPILPGSGGESGIARLVPAVLAAALMATGLVSLAIATAFERGYGVLKRLAASPAPTWTILASRVAVVAATVLLQVALIAVVATIVGWRPAGGLLLALGAALPWILLGTICFAAAGLLLAGRLRPETVLAVSNGLFVLALLLGGVLIPLDLLPSVVAVPASLLPPALLTGLLSGALGGGSIDPLGAALLTAWTVLFAAASVSGFRSADQAQI
jgi:ABC-2 type transport system permease protein